MKKITLTLITLIWISIGQAQTSEKLNDPEELEITSKDSIVVSSWMTSIGWNFVNDAGGRFNQPFKVKDRFNAVAFPSRLSIGRYFKSGIGLEAIATYNKYKEGNIIDGLINPEDKDYFGIDSRLSYDLNKLFGETGFFDPYLSVGLGYTDANDVGRGTYNAGLGFRFWFSDRWALDLNTSGKWSFGNEASNHVQHALGVIYQFQINKELSKKGSEKLAMIQALEREKQRVNDSIASARKAKEEAIALAEQLARKREIAEENARLEAENKRKTSILQAVEDLGHVIYDFNSSYLNKENKEILDKLIDLMKAHPSLTFVINAHADSRGSNEYNFWLSERRAKRVTDYLTSRGIVQDRVSGKGHGEEILTNHCKDGVHCTSAEHRANRRTEFKIIGL
ncbi:MAG: OmpA family protein [Flavobacteriaceae bacterium]